MKTLSLSFQWSDKLGAAIRERSTEPYPIECHMGADFEALSRAINQGIDPHLEAIQFYHDIGEYGRQRVTIEPQSLHVLVRRLMEDDDEEAQSLASGICSTLEIELV